MCSVAASRWISRSRDCRRQVPDRAWDDRVVRLAIVSDVHGSLNALEAVIAAVERDAPDLVWHGGDLVLMGAQPAEVVDRIRELGWPGVVGNTDEAVWRPEERSRQHALTPKLASLVELIFERYVPATSELLGPERLEWLRRLPPELRVQDLLLIHAAPGDLWRAPMSEASDAELSAVYGSCEAGTVVYGHIHRPYVRPLGSLTVANSGSVALSFDGDPRASYLLIEDGHIRVSRVEYDVEREVQLLLGSGYPDAGRLAEMCRRGAFVQPSD